MTNNNRYSTIIPKVITSPISGQPSKPVLKTYIRNKQTVVEAEYYDPASGAFIRKGIVSATPVT